MWIHSATTLSRSGVEAAAVPTSLPSVGRRAAGPRAVVVYWVAWRGWLLLTGAGTAAGVFALAGAAPGAVGAGLTALVGLGLLVLVGGLFRLESFGRLVAIPTLALVAVGDAVYGALAAPALLVYAAVDAGVVAYLVVADDAYGVDETARESRLAGVARVVEGVDPREEDD